MLLAVLSPHFQSLPRLLTELSLSGADFQVGGFVYGLRPYGSLQWTLLWDWEFPPSAQPPQVFTTRDFEALFPLVGTLGCTVCLTLQLFLLVYPYANVGPPDLSAAAPPSWSTSHHLIVHPLCPPISTPPISLDECFFFNSLVVVLLYTLVFLQFWLFFVFKLLVVFLLFVWGHSVSTYTSMLSRSLFLLLLKTLYYGF